MLIKTLFALLIILCVYVLAVIDKASRRDILHQIKQIPHKIKGLVQRMQDDDKEAPTEEEMNDEPMNKVDYLENCKQNGVRCDSLGCWQDFKIKPDLNTCKVSCECFRCVYGACPPSLKNKE